jgi:hypothetical protein
MAVSDQLHSQAALPPGKGRRLIHWIAGLDEVAERKIPNSAANWTLVIQSETQSLQRQSYIKLNIRTWHKYKSAIKSQYIRSNTSFQNASVFKYMGTTNKNGSNDKINTNSVNAILLFSSETVIIRILLKTQSTQIKMLSVVSYRC